MCGIVGATDSFLRQQGLDPAAAMQCAVQALAWRGPDGHGVERAGAWWLGCARLAISGPGSRQPVVRRGGGFAGVLNGAVTDARERWPQFLRRLPRGRLPNDAWLPVLAVERGRAADVMDFAGHRAVAVLDVAAGRLRLWRDPFGEKPLFVAERGGAVVAFASTVRALAAFGLRAELPGDFVAQFFRCGWSAVAIGGGVVPFAPSHPTEAPSDGDLRAALTVAVQRCADAAVPVAVSLSGGIDSSCLLAAARAGGRRLPAYQFCADGEAEHERAVAAAVATHLGCELRPVGGGAGLQDALPALTTAWGLPLGDPSLLAVHAVARAAARDGCRVLLSGEGGDELLLGYRRHAAMAWPLPRWLPWRPRRSMAWPARWLRAAAQPDPYGALLEVTSPAFRDEVLADCAAPGAPDATRDLERIRRRDLTGYLAHDLLPKLDVATMAAGVEARAPFLDPTVVAAALAIPARRALGKRPLRLAFRTDLPATLWRQRKRGFAVPIDRWLRSDGLLVDVLRDRRTAQRPHLRPSGLAAALDRHRRGAGSGLGHGLYLIAAFELWLRSREAAP